MDYSDMTTMKPEKETKMLAFKNTIENKTQAVAAAKRHRKLDMLIQGTYAKGNGDSFKGCSVGCTYKPFEHKVPADSLHALSEPVHGIPRSLTYLRDKIFERLSVEDSKNWHVDFTVAISVGADLSGVIDKWMYFLMTDKQGIVKHAKGNVLVSIQAVASLYARKIKGDSPTREEWVKARTYADADADADAAAYAAADAAAAAYADADADAAAYAYAAAAAAAYAAAAAAAAAAAYAAAAAAAAAARRKYFKRAVDQLLKIIKAA